MTMLDHLDELRKRLIYIFATVGIITIFVFSFGLRETVLNGYTIYYPYPDVYDNISSQFLKKLRHDLVPSYVELIVTTPSEAIVVLIYVSMFFGVLLGMPIIVYQIAKFIGPGLLSSEKKLIGKVTLPAVTLFAAGAIFSYIFVIPFTIDFLFRYGVYLEVRNFMTIEAFISFVLLFILAFGLSFQLPIFMVGITSLGIVEPDFWKQNFSYAVLGMLIFGAIITPDGSGITMFLVAGPMILLYVGGYLWAKWTSKKDE